MSWAITGAMIAPYGKDAPDYKGRVSIKWSGRTNPKIPNQIIPSVLTIIYDEGGEILPFAHAVINLPPQGIVTADIAVYLDDRGDIIYDLNRIAQSEAIPATFPFLVSGMDV